LTRHFLGQAARELGVESKVLRPETETYLVGLDWPGNVRQLENLCRWLTVMASGREIHLEDLPMELRERGPAAKGGGPGLGSGLAVVGQPKSGCAASKTCWKPRCRASSGC
jgi:DNA-binding NtrC family response regulator